MIRKYKAYIFDLNGTMVDDMQYHILAWHRILHSLGAELSLEKMKQECYGKNEELIERILPGRFSEAEKKKMSIEKEKLYQDEFRPYLRLLSGLHDFIISAHSAGIKMAIGSAANMNNIDFVIDGLNLRPYFFAFVSADDVLNSKPDPETFLECAVRLNVQPKDCLVFEDAPRGVQAAANASMDCVVITTLHRKEEFYNFKNTIGFIPDFIQLNHFI